MPSKYSDPSAIPFPITCVLCGETFNAMITHSHLRAAHQVTTKEYVLGGDPLTNSDWVAQKAANQLGENHPSWKGGYSVNGAGYVTHWTGTKNVYEHRLVMEAYLGRTLFTNEQVHHKDGNPANNELSNLELVNPSHHQTHHLRDKWAEGGVFRKKFPEGNPLVDLTCDYCGKPFVLEQQYINRRQNKYGQEHFYCSTTCANRQQQATKKSSQHLT